MSPSSRPGFFHWRDVLAFVGSLALSGALGFGLVALIGRFWNVLPVGVTLLLCILLAVGIIGMPIYSLWRWSERYLARIGSPRRRGR